MLRYILYKVLIFIPIFWIGYLFHFDLSYPMILRICCLIMCLILAKVISSKIILEPNLLTFYHDATMNSLSSKIETPLHDYKIDTFKKFFTYNWAWAYSLGDEIARKDILKIPVIILVLLGSFFGNPVLGNYTGVSDYHETFRGSQMSGDFHPLYSDKAFKTKENAGFFDDLENYSTKSFIFKETGILSGYYPRTYNFFNSVNILKMLFLPFLEAIIKAIIWVPIYFLICIYFYKKSENPSRIH